MSTRRGRAGARRTVAVPLRDESSIIMGPKLVDYEKDDSESSSEGDRNKSMVAETTVPMAPMSAAAVVRPSAVPLVALVGASPSDGDGSSVIAVAGQGRGEEEDEEEEDEEEDSDEEEEEEEDRVCTQDEAGIYLAELLAAHTKRATLRKESATLDRQMKDYKRKLIAFMRKYNQPRMGNAEEGKYFTSKYVEKNRGVRKNDLMQLVERDFGEAKRQQYERELQTLSKQKIRVLDNRITYIGLRVAGEHHPAAAPPRKRARAADGTATSSTVEGRTE